MCGFHFASLSLNSSVFLTVEGMSKNKLCKGDISFSFRLSRLDITRSGRFSKKMKQIKVTVADLCFDGNTQKKSWPVSEKGKKRDITSDG